MIRPIHLPVLLLLFVQSCSLDSGPGFPVRSTSCLEARASVSAAVGNGSMVLIPGGCRNFYNPGAPPRSDSADFLCVSSFWMDTVEVSASAYRTFFPMAEPTVHSYAACPNCPMDNLTYFEAILYANARTKAELNPQDTVYTYTAVVSSATQHSQIRRTKANEVTDLVGLQADTRRKGYQLPSRAQFGWAILQDRRDTSLLHPEVDSLYNWNTLTSGGTTHPVGILRPNLLGIHDGNGNVNEWTSTLDSVRLGPIESPYWKLFHMALGGSWEGDPSAERDSRTPYSLQDWDHAGIRLVRRDSSAVTSVVPRPCR